MEIGVVFYAGSLLKCHNICKFHHNFQKTTEGVRQLRQENPEGSSMNLKATMIKHKAWSL